MVTQPKRKFVSSLACYAALGHQIMTDGFVIPPNNDIHHQFQFQPQSQYQQSPTGRTEAHPHRRHPRHHRRRPPSRLRAERLFPRSVYDAISDGRIAVIPNFLPEEEVTEMRNDAAFLHRDGRFSTDALASYGRSGRFDPSKDRAVLKLDRWKDAGMGDWSVRERFGDRMGDLREDLSRNLDRPGLLIGDSVSRYGSGSTEISYARFGPGASLDRHVDEHHEELKGRAGWSKPTRRSVTWLIYLNEGWDAGKHGGCLRCYERSSSPSARTGARGTGDLQIGWLKADPTATIIIGRQQNKEEPVFMDAQHSGTAGGGGGGANSGLCALYVDDPATPGGRRYISRSFRSHPTLYVGGSELLVRSTLLNSKDLARRFRLIERPKSVLTELMGPEDSADERTSDVEPIGGTLVLFDSVTLPHAVLPTTTRERWSASGWMHEDQQPVETHPHFDLS